MCERQRQPTVRRKFLQHSSIQQRVFSRRQIEQADKARMLQGYIGWPSTADFKQYINQGHILNCPVISDDVNRAEAIYGPLVPLLKGKTTRRNKAHISNQPFVPIPNDLVAHHPTDELDIDHFFVNSTCFIHTKSKNSKLITTKRTETIGMAETL